MRRRRASAASGCPESGAESGGAARGLDASRAEAATSARATAAASRSRACRISLRVSISSARIRSISSRAFEPSERRASSSAACSAIVASRCSSSICIRAAACSAAARRFSERFRSRRTSIESASASCRSTISAAASSQPSAPPSHSRPISSTNSGNAPAKIAARKVGSPSTARRTRPSAVPASRRCDRNGLSSFGNGRGGRRFWPSAAIKTANSSADRSWRWSIAVTC